MSNYTDSILIPNEILKIYWNNSMPINPITICNSLGITVYNKKETNDDIIGKFGFHNKKPYIIVKPFDNIYKTRILISHILGHYYLKHKDNIVEYENNLVLYNIDEKEKYANIFALNLLTPVNVVEYAVKISDLNTVKQIADYFQIPEEYMRYKLKTLNYI